MLNSLFNEKRRADLRKAIDDGGPIVFRKQKPAREEIEPQRPESSGSGYRMPRFGRTGDVNPAESFYGY